MTLRYLRSADCIYLFEPLEVPKASVSPEVSHHILVVDRSGSMYYDIDNLKQSIEQALTVDSVTGTPDTLTTLISYSSRGDVTLHWSKVPVSKVVELNSSYVKTLRAIRATALTSPSQALELALQQVDNGQTTGITHFTDGWANHPSASSENKALDDFARRASCIPGLFMNCIGYRDWCDWPRMKAMSNALSGTTVQARSFSHVLEAMQATQKLLAGGVRPSVTFPAGPGFVMTINKSTGKVNSGQLQESYSLVGLSETDDIEAWRITELPLQTRGPRGATAIGKEEMWRAGALITCLVTQLDLRAAKELLFLSGNKTLWEEHQAAVTPSSLAALLHDLELWTTTQDNGPFAMGRNTKPKHTIFDFAKALNAAPRSCLALDTESFYKDYRRRSEKRKSLATVGTRSDSVYIRGMSFNRSEATVQLETVAAMELVDAKGNAIREVARVPLDGLKEYRSFTLFSSGERNVDVVPLEVANKQGIAVLAPFLTPAKVRSLKVGSKVKIELKRFGMTTESELTQALVLKSVDGLRHAEAEVKFLSAARDKVATANYSPEQLAALQAVHLTGALYYSPPTTTLFEDRDEAISKGWIDAYTRYTVNFGTLDILNNGAFRSGNAFLERWYTVKRNGEVVSKPKLNEVYYDESVTFEKKEVRRGEDTAADLLMADVFERRLGAERVGPESVEMALAKFQSIVDETYNDLAPLVLEMGCTGLLPGGPEWEMNRYEPDEFAEDHEIKLKKAEKEGVFYVGPGELVVSIVPQTGWYTTQAGLDAAK